jgi:hypothetical protein
MPNDRIRKNVASQMSQMGEGMALLFLLISQSIHHSLSI